MSMFTKTHRLSRFVRSKWAHPSIIIRVLSTHVTVLLLLPPPPLLHIQFLFPFQLSSYQDRTHIRTELMLVSILLQQSCRYHVVYQLAREVLGALRLFLCQIRGCGV
ncbi:hypothetical protein KC19_10G109700 [Ceratodon purpureus]|uniref:Uncharacterized protein n=1 Tax=Ceratodon purpureus TaxID=3225 RepID=A0A8T0GP47_CERPU|nr:hypothetical protein KC19_10G109700 [Ceratodon purpureus]